MKALVAWISAFALVYLLGAFVAADFNIANWQRAGRLMVAVIGACAACVAGGITYE